MLIHLHLQTPQNLIPRHLHEFHLTQLFLLAPQLYLLREQNLLFVLHLLLLNIVFLFQHSISISQIHLHLVVLHVHLDHKHYKILLFLLVFYKQFYIIYIVPRLKIYLRHMVINECHHVLKQTQHILLQIYGHMVSYDTGLPNKPLISLPTSKNNFQFKISLGKF